MEEDKKTQSLLTSYAIQEPSQGFEEKVMQLIASKTIPVTPLISDQLKRLLLIIFSLVVVALLVTSFFLDPKIFTLHISTPAANVYRQLFTFFIVFWIVMLTNIWWNKRASLLTT